ncbi:MAG: hypothetical protein EOO10_15520 [Chitinophagaceae bacterium]|nr:MAG: hypothetical protein EOO10_15520 [Chitinophagaceae bacterium]
MIQKLSFIFLSLTFALISCTKEEDKNSCWQAFDPAGYDAQGLLFCDKTLAEAQAQYPQFWLYNAAEGKFCWRTVSAQGYTSYARQVPESMMEKLKLQWALTASQVDCNSFCTWTYQDKFKSKTTGLFSPTRQSRETYLADSCGKLYEGRMVVLKETADSIYTREFVRKEL